MLEIFRFGIVPLLPGELSQKTISKPDQQNNSEVGISQIRLVSEDVPAPKVSMHQSPRLVNRFALNYIINNLTQFLS